MSRRPQTSRGAARVKNPILYATPTPPNATNALKRDRLQSGVTLTVDGKGVVFGDKGRRKKKKRFLCPQAGRGAEATSPLQKFTRLVERTKLQPRLRKGFG